MARISLLPRRPRSHLRLRIPHSRDRPEETEDLAAGRIFLERDESFRRRAGLGLDLLLLREKFLLTTRKGLFLRPQLLGLGSDPGVDPRAFLLEGTFHRFELGLSGRGGRPLLRLRFGLGLRLRLRFGWLRQGQWRFRFGNRLRSEWIRGGQRGLLGFRRFDVGKGRLREMLRWKDEIVGSGRSWLRCANGFDERGPLLGKLDRESAHCLTGGEESRAHAIIGSEMRRHPLARGEVAVDRCKRDPCVRIVRCAPARSPQELVEDVGIPDA